MNTKRLLREILKNEKTILVPGVYDAFSAKILKQAGFEVLYMTGAGVTASLTGWPDVGILSMTEMVNQARHIANATALPLICDADTGYGNSINVLRTVREYEQAGVAGIHIEDLCFPKGKGFISAEEMVGKIEAALYAREDEDFFLIARTDTRPVFGLKEALRRAHVYAEAGADMIFIELPQSVEELQIISRELADVPLLVDVVEGGKTPVLPFEEYQEMGFKIVLYPTSGIRAAAKTLQELAFHLKERGSGIGFEECLVGFDERNKITGFDSILEMEKRFVKKD